MAQCNYCLKCTDICPSGNLFVWNNRVCAGDKCTGCYRCVNTCPTRAVSFNTKNKPSIAFKQAKFNNFKDE